MWGPTVGVIVLNDEEQFRAQWGWDIGLPYVTGRTQPGPTPPADVWQADEKMARHPPWSLLVGGN